MKQIFLLRHAAPDRQTYHGADLERPLIEAGKVQASRMGQRMHDQLGIPDFIISSPALRTRQTLDHLRLDKKIPRAFIDYIYLPSREDLERAITLETPENAARLLIISHYPGVLDFLNFYAPTPKSNFPEGALARFETPVFYDLTDLKFIDFINQN